jgi:hypothetical protein
MAGLTTTEEIAVDLLAMRRWHWVASCDKNRDADQRAWHRGQVRAINERLKTRLPSKMSSSAIGLIEFAADDHREKFYAGVRALRPWTWEKFCELATAHADNPENR